MLTDRDEAIIEALCLRVRLFTTEQIAGAWWNDRPAGLANARRRLRQLHAMGHIEPWKVKAHPLLDLKAPVASWSYGEPEPDPGPVSYKLRSRWNAAPKSTTVWIASKRSLAHFGATKRRFTHPLQATHDLHVSAVYLRVRAWNPKLATRWLGEDEIRPEHEGKLPDAVLLNEQGSPGLVIEFGGSYSAERVEAFHEHCIAEGLPYQLW